RVVRGVDRRVVACCELRVARCALRDDPLMTAARNSQLGTRNILSRDARILRPSAIRAFAKLINDPNVISFAGGVPSPETLPAERVAAIAERVIREHRAVALQYGPTAGLPRLREFVAGVCRNRGIDCSADDVLLTTGSQQALDRVAHGLLDPGDGVLFGRAAEFESA